jgi:predicted MPP superfamily phosphohydrolase
MQKEFIICGIILLMIIWTFIERKLLMTTKHTVVSSKLPVGLNNTSFVVLADLHNCSYGRNNSRLIRRIDALSPDFIIVAGDIINKKNVCYPSNAYLLLEQLAKKYRIFYAYGNHEQKLENYLKLSPTERSEEETRLCSTWVEYKNRLKKNKVIFLDNDSITINLKSDKIKITGLSLGSEYFVFNEHKEMDKNYIASLVGESAKDCYQLLIAHNPIYFSDYAAWGADLTLAGHLHGGMMRLPGIGGVISPQAKFFPKYDTGRHELGECQMVVSRGLGSHSIMPRIFNIPELIHITLQHKA